MIKKLTDDILAIVYRIVEIQEQEAIDADAALSELATLKEKLDGIGAQIDFEEEGYFSMEHDPEKEYKQLEKFHKAKTLYKNTLRKIKTFQTELSGYDGQSFVRGMFPNDEDYQDYLDGEL